MNSCGALAWGRITLPPMVVMLGVGFVPPPVQGAETRVPGRADEARLGSLSPSITTYQINRPAPVYEQHGPPRLAIWRPPWESTPFVAPVAAQWVAPWCTAPVDPFAPVVVEYISPSACEAIALCPRKWAFPKLDRVQKESSAAAELGTAMHAQHDRFFTEGTPYDLTTRAGELALATDHLLPDRDTPGLRTEQEIRFQHPALPGVWFGGKVDLNWSQPVGQYVVDAVPPTMRVVLDHKSSGKEKYMKLTREALLGHPQAPVYGQMFFTGLGEERRQLPDGSKVWVPWGIAPPDVVELRWNYVKTEGKAHALKSWHQVTREEVNAAFDEHVLPHARKLLEIVQMANDERAMGRVFGAEQVEAKPGEACFAFGGCPFRSRCGARATPLEGVTLLSNPVDPGASNFLNRVTGGAVPPNGAQPPQAWQPPQGQAAPQGWQPPQGQAAPQGWQPPQGQAAPAPQYPPQGQGAPPGYGPQINPPENGLQAPPVQQSAPPQYGAPVNPNGAPPPDAAAAEKQRKKEEKAAAKAAAQAAAQSAPAVVNNAGGPSFEALAMASCLGSLSGALAQQMIEGSITPAHVVGLSTALVQEAARTTGVK